MTNSIRRHSLRGHQCCLLLGATSIVFIGLVPTGSNAQTEMPIQPTILTPAITPPVVSSSAGQSSAIQSSAIRSPALQDPPLTPEQEGDLHMARRRYQAAIQAYHQASLHSPTVWNKMGMANQQMFNLGEAKKDYEASLKINPKNSDVLNNLATVYYAYKQYAIAEHLYRKALKLEPASALVYKNLGTDLLAEDKFKKGWDCYQEALKIDPEIFERANQFRIGEPTPVQKRGAMNFFLAKSYARVGMTDRAIGYLRMAIDEGFTDRKKIMADTEFASLRGNSAFEQLLSEQRSQ